MAKLKMPVFYLCWIGFIGGLVGGGIIMDHAHGRTWLGMILFAISMLSLILMIPIAVALDEGWFECAKGRLRKHDWHNYLDISTDRYSRYCKKCGIKELGTPVWMTYEGY